MSADDDRKTDRRTRSGDAETRDFDQGSVRYHQHRVNGQWVTHQTTDHRKRVVTTLAGYTTATAGTLPSPQ